MTTARFFFLVIMIVVIHCGCTTNAASHRGTVVVAAGAIPTWERPGFGGAVRPEMGSPQPGEAAPELSLPDLDGQMRSLASLHGHWVVLHFTATWCPFCDAEIEHLGELADAFADRDVKTVVVDVEEDAATWAAYARQHVRASMLALHDRAGAGSARFAPPRAQASFDDRAQATLDGTLIIDPQGAIRLFLLPDSAHFDPTFRAVRAELDRIVPPVIVSITTPRRAIAIPRGGHEDVAIELAITPGYHVMSDRPTLPTYIATRLAIAVPPSESGDLIIVHDVSYPAATPFALDDDHTIATFTGRVILRFPIDVARTTPLGPRRINASLRYQACTESRCLFPVTRDLSFTIDVTDTSPSHASP